jgi:hypothetical protein
MVGRVPRLKPKSKLIGLLSALRPPRRIGGHPQKFYTRFVKFRALPITQYYDTGILFVSALNPH